MSDREMEREKLARAMWSAYWKDVESAGHTTAKPEAGEAVRFQWIADEAMRYADAKVREAQDATVALGAAARRPLIVQARQDMQQRAIEACEAVRAGFVNSSEANIELHVAIRVQSVEKCAEAIRAIPTEGEECEKPSKD